MSVKAGEFGGIIVMRKIIMAGSVLLGGLLLAGCGNSSSKSSSSNSDLKKETTSQLNKKYTSKIAEHAQEGKLTSDEKLILAAHDKVQAQEIDKTKAKFIGKTAIFPKRGTVEITHVAKVPTYDDNTATGKRVVVVIAKITNTSKKTRSTDNIQTGNNEDASLGLTVYQNSDSTKENLSDDHEIVDPNALYNDATAKLTDQDLSFQKPSILPEQSVNVVYEAFNLVNNKNPLIFKIQDGTGESNSSDMLSGHSTVKIPMSNVKEATLSSLIN